MSLDGEVAIGCLDPVRASGAPNLPREPRLGFRPADVLNHGVTEDDIERPVGKREKAAIAVNVAHAGEFRFSVSCRPRHIEQDDLGNLGTVE